MRVNEFSWRYIGFRVPVYYWRDSEGCNSEKIKNWVATFSIIILLYMLYIVLKIWYFFHNILLRYNTQTQCPLDLYVWPATCTPNGKTRNNTRRNTTIFYGFLWDQNCSRSCRRSNDDDNVLSSSVRSRTFDDLHVSSFRCSYTYSSIIRNMLLHRFRNVTVCCPFWFRQRTEWERGRRKIITTRGRFTALSAILYVVVVVIPRWRGGMF